MLKKIFSSFLSHQSVSKPLKRLLSILPTAACVLNKQGDILFVNTRLAAALGYTPEEMTGTPIANYGLTLTDIMGLLRDETGAKKMRELIKKDMQVAYISVGASYLSNGEQILLSFDEASQYNDTLGEKRLFEAVVQRYPLAVMVQDRRGICRIWNREAEQLFSRPASEAVGKPVRQIIPAGLLHALDVVSKNVTKSGHSYLAHQMTFKDSSEKEIVLSVSQVPMLDESGDIDLLLTIFEDITQRHNQEVDLLQTRNLLQAILDHIPLGIYTRTVDGDMTYFNKQSQILLAESDPKYTNSPHPNQDVETVKGYTERERKLIEEGKMREYPDEAYIDHDGHEKLLHIIKVPLMQAGPRPLVLSIVDDVTKKRAQEKEIINTNGLLSAILENAPIGLYARTKDGKMLFSNKMSEEIFQDENAKDERGFSSHETTEQVCQYLNRESQVLESGKPLFIDEEPYQTGDGKTHILRMIKVPVQGADLDSGFVITLVEDITERKEQERKLEEYTKFQQAMLDNAPLAIYATRTDRSMAFANQKTFEMFPGDSIENKPGTAYAKREQEVFEKGEILDIPEEEYISHDGKQLMMHLIKVPIFDKDKKPYMMLSIAEDITLRKQQEQELHRAKNFLQNVVNNLPVALSVKKSDGEYVLWNKRSEEVFGVAAKDVIGKYNYRTDISKEQAEFMQEADKGVFESGRELNIAQELISTPKEGVKIMHTVKTPLFTEDGNPDYLLSVSEDITAQTNMERQMRKTGEKNTLLVESAREGIVILEDHQVMYANRSAGKLLGFGTPEELVGKRLVDFIVTDYQSYAKEKYDAVMSGLQETDKSSSLHFITQQGARVELETAISVSKYLGRRIVLVFLHDVTSSNKAMRELRKEQELFKQVFELGLLPAFVLNSKGYISSMNHAARRLFNLTSKERNFYRNVYIRPALPLQVRRQMRQGQAAEFDYVFDFERAAAKFPGRINGSGQIPLHLTLYPFNLRNQENGEISADYLVTLERTDGLGQSGGRLAGLADGLLQRDLSQENESPEPSINGSAEAVPSAEKQEKQTANATSLGAASELFIQTLSSVNLPAVVLDKNTQVYYANSSFLSAESTTLDHAKGQDFFQAFVENPATVKKQFKNAQDSASGNAFQVTLELKTQTQSVLTRWDVFVIKDASGQVESYGLLSVQAA